MIESLLTLMKYETLEKYPWVMFIWAFGISSMGIFFSYWLDFQVAASPSVVVSLSGLFSVIFTIIPSVYFLTVFIKRQERMDERDIAKHYEKGFWARHDKDVLIFLFYFFGLTFAFAVWAQALPAGTFQIQLLEIQKIRTMTGNMMYGYAAGDEFITFFTILRNNLQVMGFAFVFSLLFGAGAVFIVVWNASILGVYVGRLSESVFHIPGEMLSFLPHGIPEIAGYLLSGLAGSIISAAIIRGHKFDIVLGVSKDAFKLLGLAILFIILGALIESTTLTTKIVSIFIFYTIFIYIVTIAISPSKNGGKK